MGVRRNGLRMTMKFSTLEEEHILRRREIQSLSRNPASHFVSPQRYLWSAEELIKHQKLHNANHLGYKKIGRYPECQENRNEQLGQHPGVPKILKPICPRYYYRYFNVRKISWSLWKQNKKSTLKKFHCQCQHVTLRPDIDRHDRRSEFTV